MSYRSLYWITGNSVTPPLLPCGRHIVDLHVYSAMLMWQLWRRLEPIEFHANSLQSQLQTAAPPESQWFQQQMCVAIKSPLSCKLNAVPQLTIYQHPVSWKFVIPQTNGIATIAAAQQPTKLAVPLPLKSPTLDTTAQVSFLLNTDGYMHNLHAV